MRYTAQSLLVVLVSFLVPSCHSFVVKDLPRRSTNTVRTNKIGPLHMSGETHFNVEAASNTEDVQCYLIENDDDDDQDDESSGDLASAKPTVVCTSEPKEHAWYNGLDENQMKPTDGTDSGATQCIEGASPRGTPEWECT